MRKKEIFIFGSGNNGKRLLQLLKMNGTELTAFIDNDKEKQGMSIDGYECISVEEAQRRGEGVNENIVLVSPHQCVGILEQLEKCGFEKVYDLHRLADRCTYLLPHRYEPGDFNNVFPFNHYESPYPDMEEVHRKEEVLFQSQECIKEISMNEKRHLELLEEMKKIEAPKWNYDRSENARYYCMNPCFPKNGADILYYMMHILHPQKIIEVGSGFSTSVMLDTNERDFNNEIEIISIEPYADRLKSLLRPTDNIQIHESKLQDIPLEFFEQLKENDILFIDSSHVSKANSDINYLFFEILPRINKGVYIHFHDIFYPFIYPKEWIYEGRAYNEAYILRAFLMHNREYSIQWFGGFMADKFAERLGGTLSGCGDGSIWIRKDK